MCVCVMTFIFHINAYAQTGVALFPPEGRSRAFTSLKGRIIDLGSLEMKRLY